MAAKRDRRMDLYKQGLTDTDIADKIGLTRSGVRSWRRRFGLPSNAKRGRPGGVPMSEPSHRSSRKWPGWGCV